MMYALDFATISNHDPGQNFFLATKSNHDLGWNFSLATTLVLDILQLRDKISSLRLLASLLDLCSSIVGFVFLVTPPHSRNLSAGGQFFFKCDAPTQKFQIASPQTAGELWLSKLPVKENGTHRAVAW